MTEQKVLDRTYNIILNRLVETGQAPHYTEIATELGIPMEEGRKALLELFSEPISAWLDPNTDQIMSFSPFNNLPNQYRISIEGHQKWFGQ